MLTPKLLAGALAVVVGTPFVITFSMDKGGSLEVQQPSLEPEIPVASMVGARDTLTRLVAEQSREQAAGTELAPESAPAPEVPEVAYGWAGFDTKVAENAALRGGMMHQHFESFVMSESPRLRRARGQNAALMAMYSILDFEREGTTFAPGEQAVYTPEEGVLELSNGGRVYKVQTGRFPVIDRMFSSDRDDPLTETEVAEIHDLYLRASEIVAPYL